MEIAARRTVKPLIPLSIGALQLTEPDMSQRFEYKFVRLEQAWLGQSPSKAAMEGYQTVVHEHAAEGWRLVQIFAPGVSLGGIAKYYELIFERPALQTPG